MVFSMANNSRRMAQTPIDFVPARITPTTVKRNELTFKPIVVDFFPFCAKYLNEFASNGVWCGVRPYRQVSCAHRHRFRFVTAECTQTQSTRSALIPFADHKNKINNIYSFLLCATIRRWCAFCAYSSKLNEYNQPLAIEIELKKTKKMKTVHQFGYGKRFVYKSKLSYSHLLCADRIECASFHL